MSESNYNSRILVFAPIHNRENILPYYLQHILQQTYPKHLISFYFIVNNSVDNSYEILKQFKLENSSEYENIKIEVFNDPNKLKFSSKKKDERTDNCRNNYSYDWLSILRNKGLSECIKGNYDYLFSCDSDILISNDTIERLMENNKPYCSSLIYNGYLYTPMNSKLDYSPIDNAYKYPNILKNVDGNYIHIVNYKTKNPNLNPKGTLIETQFTGAIYLAKQEVCKVMEYKSHKQGEDLYASLSAINAGYTLYCDISLFNVHCMSQGILDLYLNGELKYANGDKIKL